MMASNTSKFHIASTFRFFFQAVVALFVLSGSMCHADDTPAFVDFKDLLSPMVIPFPSGAEEPIKSYKHRITAGSRIFSETQAQGGFGVAYQFYFGGIPDYSKIPVDLLPFLMRRSSIRLETYEISFDHDDDDPVYLDDINNYSVSFGIFPWKQKKTEFYYKHSIDDYKYHDTDDYLYDVYEETHDVIYVTIRIRHYLKPDLVIFSCFESRYFESKIGAGPEDDLDYSDHVEEQEKRYTAGIEFVWSIYTKLLLGYEAFNWNYDREVMMEVPVPDRSYESDSDSKGYVYGGIDVYLNPSLSFGYYKSHLLERAYLSYYFKRRINISLMIDDNDVHDSDGYKSKRFELSYRF